MASLTVAESAFSRLSITWKNRCISFQVKLELYRALGVVVTLRGCESGTLTTETDRRVEAFEMKYFRRQITLHFLHRTQTNETTSELAGWKARVIGVICETTQALLVWSRHSVQRHLKNNLQYTRENNLQYTREDNLQDTREDNLPDTLEDNLLDTREDNLQDTREDNLLDTREDNLLDTRDDNLPDTREDNLPDTREDNLLDTREDKGRQVRQKKTGIDQSKSTDPAARRRK